MNKSQFHQVDNAHSVVTGADVGQEVEVNGIGRGILQYVGGIANKDGLFCGVELFAPEGKHNGTFQNIAYFSCPDGHGIFAPLYKVQLLHSPQQEKKTVRIDDRLSRSALPSLQLHNVFSPASPARRPRPPEPRPSDVMQASMMTMTMSTGSDSFMNQSFLLDGSWSADCDMSASNNTFVFGNRRQPLFLNANEMDDDEEDDLMAVTAPKSMFTRNDSYEEDEEDPVEQQLATSMVLESSRFAPDRLPRVDDVEEELEPPTPLVEHAPPTIAPPSTEQTAALSVSPPRNGAVSRSSVDTGYEASEPNDSFNSLRLSPIQGDQNRESNAAVMMTPSAPSTSAAPAAAAAPSLPPSAPAARLGGPIASSTPNEKAAAVKKEKEKKVDPNLAKIQERKEREKREKEERERKQKEELAEKQRKIREEKERKEQEKKEKEEREKRAKEEAVEKARRAREEKEQEKQRKAAEAAAAKAAAAATRTQRRGSEADENDVASIASSSSRLTPRRGEPLRAVNSPAPRAAPATAPAKEPRKARQSLLPPPREKRIDSVSSGASAASSRRSLAPAALPKKSFPTSSFAVPRPGPLSANRPSPASKPGTSRATAVPVTPAEKKIPEVEKLSRLRLAASAAAAMSLVAQKAEGETAALRDRVNELHALHAASTSRVSSLEARETDLVQQLERERESAKEQFDSLRRQQDDEVVALKKQHEKQMAEATEAHKRAIDEERAKHETELANVQRRHQQTIAQLDDKVCECERLCDQLRDDKKQLQSTLEQDKDEKVQMLSQEISSLNTAMSLKSQEMKELRQRNQQLLIQIEEIPPKDLEISKLKYKVHELKENLNQKIESEKALIYMNEEMRRNARTFNQMEESYRNEIDVLKFKMEESIYGDDTITDQTATPSKFFTPNGKVTFRQRPSSESRPGSVNGAIPNSARLSCASDRSDRTSSVMEKSVLGALIQARSSMNGSGNEDVIYAPDEVLCSGDKAAAIDRNVNGQADSGIGI